MQTVLAKARYDNIADSTDELTFRKGDIITVLEKDIDGLLGWWLCSLHGRQGIAPGNRLTEIGAGTHPSITTPTSPKSLLDELDYAVPKPFEEQGEDYDVPRSVLSPQDYDFPKADDKFNFETVENGTEKKTDKDKDGNIYQEIYDVPYTPSPKKVPPPRPPVSPAVKRKFEEKTQVKTDDGPGKDKTNDEEPVEPLPPRSPIPKPHPKPPRASKLNTDKNKAEPPARPPKPASFKAKSKTEGVDGKGIAKEDKGIYAVPCGQEIYEVPKTDSKVADESTAEKNNNLSSKDKVSDTVKADEKAINVVSSSVQPGTPSSASKDAAVNDNKASSYPEDIYDVPTADLSSGEIYDVPAAIKALQDEDIYDTPPRIPTGTLERQTSLGSKQDTNHGAHMLSKTVDVNHNKRNEKAPEGPAWLVKGDSGSFGRKVDPALKRSSDGSTGKRSSNSSTGSGKQSSDSDDYVDYQDIYGDGHDKHVNIYDVPVQHVQVSDIETAPVEKKTAESILQRINMSAVKGLKLDPPGALQRLSKLEQAVDVTVSKLLSYVTTKWRDPVLLRPKIADIRDIAGKGKVALRLLTEFGLSTLVNARSLANEELVGKLSRAIEPLLETYYSLKVALQRLDESNWKSPLQRPDDGHDDLDLIMVYIRSVPEGSKKLASIVRTTATVLFNRPKKPPVLLPTKEQKLPKPDAVSEGKSPAGEPVSKVESSSRGTKPPATKPKPALNGKDAKPVVNGDHKEDKSQVERKASIEEEGERPRTGTVAQAIAKVEKIGLSPSKADSEEISSTAMMLGLIKQSVEENIKPSGRKFSPGTVRRLCGMDGEIIEDGVEGARTEGEVPVLPPRRPSTPSKGAPPPPARRDSGERLQHVRQKSLERFVPEGESPPVTNGPPNPPPKPKLDRHKTMRKSYKYPMRHEKVRLRDKVEVPESPTGKRKCNSDPTDLEMSPEEDAKQHRASDSLEGKVPENGITINTNSVHISDSDLPTGLRGQSTMTPLSPKLDSPSSPKKSIVQRSKSFSRTKPSSTKTTMVEESGLGDFILSFSDKELLEFYKYEIDAQLFVLNEAMKGLFTSVDTSQPPKTFVSNSKFVVLSAHKFIYIGDTLQRKISHDKLGMDVTSATAKLSECVKTLVHATKMAALQYPAMNPMRDLTTAAAEVSEASIALHKVVKSGQDILLTG